MEIPRTLRPDAQRLAHALDDQWRSARELAQASGVSRWMAPSSLKELRSLGLAEARRMSLDANLEYRRAE